MSYWTEWMVMDANRHILEPSISLDSVLQMDIEHLAMLLGASYLSRMECVCEEPLVVRVSETLVRALADLDPVHLEGCARQWMECEGMKDKDPEEVRALVQSMQEHCLVAIDSDLTVVEKPAM